MAVRVNLILPFAYTFNNVSKKLCKIVCVSSRPVDIKCFILSKVIFKFPEYFS